MLEEVWNIEVSCVLYSLKTLIVASAPKPL